MTDPTSGLFIKIFDSIFSFKRNFNSENLIEEVKKRIRVFFICVFGIFASLFYILVMDEENWKNFYNSLHYQTIINWVSIVAIIVLFFVLIVIIFELNRRINNFKKPIETLSDNPKIIESSIISKIDLLEGKIKLNYIHSQLFIERIIKKYIKTSAETEVSPAVNLFEKFVEEFKEVNKDIKTKDLTIISDEVEKSTDGYFYCVISYDGFFEGDNQTEESIRYFASFYKGTNRNFVQRLFTVPGVGTKFTRYKLEPRTEDEIKKSCILLKYLIVNVLTSVETYLLIYDKDNLHSIQDEFFTIADYVIAMPSNLSVGNLNKLYFAYPKLLTGKDQVVATSDTYLIQLMKKDFDYRIDKIGKNNMELNILELRMESYDNILEMLGFDLTDKSHIVSINNQIAELQTLLIKMANEDSYYDKTAITNKLAMYYKKGSAPSKKPSK